ncbi:hypothetical protein HZI73_15055 [Vallitalea pronyensis]|uniref:Lipoprotein n=1 Tax=Vallitalea pronyensis TaxID=1348613 RepID=A0A8J8ML51_9FIRM|nr:hypothetical protein [Vallitalea pronyensis]QUI23521.1 hypothetical protein HZI73_15055 [Vallitalea pronyensis]
MIKKLFVLFIITCLIASGCGTKQDDKKNTSLVSKSLKYQLVNITDEIIKLLEDKDYIKCYDELTNFHEKANEVGVYYVADNDPDAVDFKSLINELSKNISNEADKQKIQQVAIDVEKSQIKILTEMAGGGKEDGEQKQSGGEQDSSKSSGGSSGDKESSENGDDMSSGGGDAQQQEKDAEIILPQEELLKKYPELLLTDNDLAIQNRASDLYKYCSYILTKEENDKKSGLIKLKYYLYKIKYLAKLDKYPDIGKYHDSLKSEWNMEFSKAQKTSEKDAKILNSIIDNLDNQIREKNVPVIEITNELAVKAINNIIDKTS